MKRTISQWQGIDPETMSKDASPAAVMFAIQDAKADILEMHAKLEKIALLPGAWRDEFASTSPGNDMYAEGERNASLSIATELEAALK